MIPIETSVSRSKVRVKIKPIIHMLGKGGGGHLSVLQTSILSPPLKKEGHIALHMSVGQSVRRYVGLP